ncbi:MAG: UDP-N-acetylenolpyruvoylglucosamine reductase, partial [Bacteroides sp.]
EYATIPHYDVDNEHVKVPAAWMIDNCGWKGRRLGNAGVHDKQALVLVNKGGATGADIIRLSTAVQASVKEKFGINIYPEVNFIR